MSRIFFFFLLCSEKLNWGEFVFYVLAWIRRPRLSKTVLPQEGLSRLSCWLAFHPLGEWNLQAWRSNPVYLRPLTRPSAINDASTPLSMAHFNAQSMTNKSFLLNNFIFSKKLDVLFLTKTWQRNLDYSSLSELCLDGYSFISQPVAFQGRFSSRSVKVGHFLSFEL